MHMVKLKGLEGNDSFCINQEAMPQAIVFGSAWNIGNTYTGIPDT